MPRRGAIIGSVAAALMIRGVHGFIQQRAPPGRLVCVRADYLSQLAGDEPPPDDAYAPFDASSREEDSQALRAAASARAAARIEGYRRGEGPPPAQAAAATAWERLVDDASGEPFYYNSATGESSWDAPSEQDAFAAPLDAPPSAWEQRVDEATGQLFYWNSATGESSWDAPAAEDAFDAPLEPPAEEETEEDRAAKAARREMIRAGSVAAAERMRAAMSQTGRASDNAPDAGSEDANLPWRRNAGPPSPAPISPAPAPLAEPTEPAFQYEEDRQQVTQLMMMLVSYTNAVSGAPGAQTPPPGAAHMLARALRATGELLRAETGS